VRLRQGHRILDLHDVQSEVSGDLAFPMVARGRLVGIIVLGHRRSGEAYAPDETAAIAEMARSVGSAIDLFWLEKKSSNWPNKWGQDLTILLQRILKVCESLCQRPCI
jgi:GAF domain-containing protein